MEFQIAINGFILGFTIAAAIGPIALLCVQRTLERGWGVGFVSGLGVATSDALYGLIGGLGLTVITNFLVGQQFRLRLVGGLALLYIGLRALFAKAEIKPAQEKVEGSSGYLGAYSSILFLTASNPMTIILFAGVYAGLGELGLVAGWGLAALFAAGIFLGSVVWWLILITGVNMLRSRFRVEMLTRLSKITAVVIVGFGVWVLISLLGLNY
jgi:threonine/homoserine/homoserine lactone efflux protein